ncbi:ABC transporter permease [Halosolutus gelatinilyticus]|uniref:ABC transporter permease n=1 Tax=Halosolutus gelatinilyticus TaxID=2931975 RepID=UPI001FF3A8D7|nr:ABC transporter permease [Halosolutus gelatinilyticus]
MIPDVHVLAIGISTERLAFLILNGLALSMLYILIASGFAVIFGITDVLNFAHGIFYMLGAYLALTVVDATGSFFLALFLAPLAVAGIGVLIERLTLHHIYDRSPLYHVLITFGVLLVVTDLVEIVWGTGTQFFQTPDALSGAATVGPIMYPRYRLFTIVAGAVVALATWLLFRYSDFGLIVRAGAQDQGTVRLMGVDISKYYTLVFGLGTLLAAIAGVLAAPFLSVNPEMGNGALIVAFVIVAIGGLGSFGGSIVAGIIVGLAQTAANTFVPELSGFVFYILLLAVLLLKPEGILGAYEIRDQSAKLSYDETIPPVNLTDRKVLSALFVLLLLPFVGLNTFMSMYGVGLVALMFVWGILALSLDTVTGYTGLISFGHAAFYGIGGYAVALGTIHVTNSFLLGLVLAMLFAGIVAWLVGAVSARLSGLYFAVVTFAVAQMLYELSVTWSDFTGGSNGLAIDRVELVGVIDVSETLTFYYVSLALLVGLYYFAKRIMYSPFGLQLKAIRESERRAAFLGYDTNKAKRRIFAISGAIGGVAGALFVTHQTFTSPETLVWIVSGDALFAMILGGVGTLFGPIIGGAVLIGLDQILTIYFDHWRLILGLIMIVIVLFAPRGLVSFYYIAQELVSGDRNPLVDRNAEIASDGDGDSAKPER